MKIIVFDDDPTGSQTVHDCLLLLKWDYQTLLKGLRSSSKLLFILCNTRSLTEKEASRRLTEICSSLIKVISNEGYSLSGFMFISRGDSTLRGHNFLEPEIINRNLGPFDATFHIPAFIEGERLTINGKHFVQNIPAHKTIFAKDKIFGYDSNNIKEILYKKSKSRIKLDDIKNLDLSDINNLQFTANDPIFLKIKNLNNNAQIIVDAKNYIHLNKFCLLINKLSFEKKFLFRTAASFISAISRIGENPKSKTYYSKLRRKDKNNTYLRGLIVVGSHVETSSLQIKNLLKFTKYKPVEINVQDFYQLLKFNDGEKLIKVLKNNLVSQIRNLINKQFTPVLFTSRKEISCKSEYEEFQFKKILSLFIAEIIHELRHEIGYLVSKGGITSNVILSEGFKADIVYLEGQIMTGISVLNVNLTKINTYIPVITFPGNIGNPDTLKKVLDILELE